MTTRLRPIDIAVSAALIAAPVPGILVLVNGARTHRGLASSLDPQVAADVLGARTSLLTHLARWLTFAGSEAVVGSLALLLVVVLLERRGPFFAGIAATAVAVSAALTVGVKLTVSRDRPGAADRLGAADGSYSFPSGHTLNSAVLLGLVVVLLVPLLHDRRARICATSAALLLALGIGASRVYLGYHWTSDVLASWLIALSLLTLVGLTVKHWGDTLNTKFAVRRQSGSRA